MPFYRVIAILMIFSALSSFNFAQTPTPAADPEKEKAAQELEKNALEMLDRAIAEAASLKLPENRALILAMAGDILWPKDAKRGKELFREAADNIVLIVNAPEDKNAPVDINASLFGRNDIHNLRQMVLTALAKHDAELALEFLLTTRPPDVAAELQIYLARKIPVPGTQPQPNQNRDSYKAEREIRLEQSLVAQSADQDPQKAAKIIRDSLAKGVTTDILPMIYKVVEKDAELANKLLAETFQKMLEADFLKNRNDYYLAVSLLRTFTQPLKDSPLNKSLSKLKADDKSLKDLALKIVDTLLKTTNYNDAFMFNSALPFIEKFFPEKMAALKQKQAALKKQVPDNIRIFETPASFSNPNATSEELIADAAKAEPQFRAMMYRQAAMRAFDGGDPEKTRSLLQNLPESKERDDAIALIDSRLAQIQLTAGKITDARKLIDRMPPGNSRIGQIVQLAISSYRLNTEESKENALILMGEAKQLIREFPEDKDETDGVLLVAAGFAVIDPPRAFALLGPVIDQANDLINASAILAKYNKQNQFFRDGEIVMAANFGSAGSKFFRYGKEIKLLAQADLGRTKNLVEQFRRDDVRIFAQIFIAQGILKEKMGLDGAMIFYGS